MQLLCIQSSLRTPGAGQEKKQWQTYPTAHCHSVQQDRGPFGVGTAGEQSQGASLQVPRFYITFCVLTIQVSSWHSVLSFTCYMGNIAGRCRRYTPSVQHSAEGCGYLSTLDNATLNKPPHSEQRHAGFTLAIQLENAWDREKEIIYCAYSLVKLCHTAAARRYLPMSRVTNAPTGDIHSINSVAELALQGKGIWHSKDSKSRIRAVNGSWQRSLHEEIFEIWNISPNLGWKEKHF